VHFEGTQVIAAPIGTVWDFLMDPLRISPCMPGFQSVDVIDARRFKARVGIGVAAIKATFTMEVTMVDVQPPVQASVKAHGVAPISAVDVASTMALHDEGNGTTTMTWTAEVVISGSLAGLGARLLNSTAQKMTGQFFQSVQAQLES
jgi:carbon monoxide dehydrogenase subunit G